MLSVIRSRRSVTAARNAFASLFGMLALLLPATAMGYAVPGPEFVGLNTQGLVKDTSIDPSQWGRYFDQMQAGQMSVARLQISWQTAEPTAPVGGVHTYNWNAGGAGSRDSIDYAVGMLAQRGIRVAPLFATVPAWESSNAYRMTSAAYPNFAAFVAAFAARYGPGGAYWAQNPGLSPEPTLEYEIWTEANSINFWTGNSNPAEYAAAMQQIAPALHAAQPGAQLLASIGWQNYASYMDSFFAAGGAAAIDGVGFHPYAPSAQAIIDLTTGLRGELQSLGRGDLPIFVTESGQPVVTSGLGAPSAGQGYVTDAARAATQAFATDALARGNCGVQQFLVYTISGSETSRESIGEGYMGVFRHADGTPYLTGAALQRSSTRWVGQYNQTDNSAANSLSLCGGSPTPTASMLALGLSLQPTNDTCALATAGYDANPLEGASLQVRAPGRPDYGQSTNAFGQNTVCLIDGAGSATYFDVYASMPGAGKSAVYRCPVPLTSAGCSIIAAAPSPAGSPLALNVGDVQPASARLGASGKTSDWTLVLKTQRPRRDHVGSQSRLRLKATLSSPTVAAGTRVRFVVQLTKKGAKRPSKVRIVQLSVGHTVSVLLRTKLSKGDQLTVLHAVTALTQDGVPRVTASTVVGAPR